MKTNRTVNIFIAVAASLLSLARHSSACPYLESREEAGQSQPEAYTPHQTTVQKQAGHRSLQTGWWITFEPRQDEEQQVEEECSFLSLMLGLCTTPAAPSPLVVAPSPDIMVPVPLATPSPTAAPTLSIQETLALCKRDISNIMNPSLAAKLLRLSFHDCVGGCDGCVDVNDPSNFGLREPIQTLAPIVNTYQDRLTRADVWALAGLTAAEVSQPSRSSVSFGLNLVGRQVCSENDPFGGPARALPSADITSSALLEFFSSNFRFNLQDTTAIMGAHTMGRAVPENSGFDGRDGWTFTPDVLDNGFYRSLLTRNMGSTFFQERQSSGKTLWRRQGSGLFMINADMALGADFDGFMDPQSGAVFCTPGSTCPDSPMIRTATFYRDNEGAWLQDFSEAFVKMTNAGCGDSCVGV